MKFVTFCLVTQSQWRHYLVEYCGTLFSSSPSISQSKLGKWNKRKRGATFKRVFDKPPLATYIYLLPFCFSVSAPPSSDSIIYLFLCLYFEISKMEILYRRENASGANPPQKNHQVQLDLVKNDHFPRLTMSEINNFSPSISYILYGGVDVLREKETVSFWQVVRSPDPVVISTCRAVASARAQRDETWFFRRWRNRERKRLIAREKK